MRVNGLEVDELVEPILDHVQVIRDMGADLLLWVEYPDVQPVTTTNSVRSSTVNLMDTSAETSLSTISIRAMQNYQRRRPVHRTYIGNGHTDLSWGPNPMIMNQCEAVVLLFWSVISMFCFPPTGLPAVCFLVFAANAFTEESMQKRRRAAYVSNVISTILGTAMIITICVLFIE